MRRLLDWPAGARWALTAAFFVGVNWLLLAPAKNFRDVHVFLAQQDKIAHAGIFLMLALLVRWSLGAGRRKPPAILWAVFAALLVYAGSIELFQPLLKKSGRAFEWLDMASNYAGVLAGWLVPNPLRPRVPGGRSSIAPARLGEGEEGVLRQQEEAG